MVRAWGWVVTTRTPFAGSEATHEAWRTRMVASAVELGARLLYLPSSARTQRELDGVEAALATTNAREVEVIVGEPPGAGAAVPVPPRSGGPVVRRWLEAPNEQAEERASTAGDRGLAERGYAGWGADGTSEPFTADRAQALRAAGATFVRLRGNLFSRRAERAGFGAARTAGLRILVADPFAEGRLNGEWLRSSPVERPSLRGPPAFAVVQRAWSPVLGLGFLTANGARSLTQAAVAYATDLAGGGTVLVEAATPEDLAEVARSPDGLAHEERARIERLADRPPAGADASSRG